MAGPLGKPAPIVDAKEDSRRSLLGEYCRLVSEASPTGFILENVASLLHPRNRPTFEAATDMRAIEECCQYIVENAP